VKSWKGSPATQKHADLPETRSKFTSTSAQPTAERVCGLNLKLPPAKPAPKKRLAECCESKKNWFRSFPSQQFQALLTLFSKFFASFPHGTCALSGFRQYLALDGSYHPEKWLGLRSQAVRLFKELTHLRATKKLALGALRSLRRLEQDCHLLWCPFPGDFDAGLARATELCNNATIPGAKKRPREVRPGF